MIQQKYKRKLFIFLSFFILIFLHVLGFYIFKDQNLFELFGINRNFDKTQLRQQSKSLYKQFHPDKNKNNPDAQDIFIKIKGYSEYLLDPKKAEVYDKFGVFQDDKFNQKKLLITFDFINNAFLYCTCFYFIIIFTYNSKARIPLIMINLLFLIFDSILVFEGFQYQRLLSNKYLFLPIFEIKILIKILIGPFIVLFKILVENVYPVQPALFENETNQITNKLGDILENWDTQQISTDIKEIKFYSNSLQILIDKTADKDKRKIKKISDIFYWVLVILIEYSLSSTIIELILGQSLE